MTSTGQTRSLNPKFFNKSSLSFQCLFGDATLGRNRFLSDELEIQ
jgi:hypothetical protein